MREAEWPREDTARSQRTDLWAERRADLVGRIAGDRQLVPYPAYRVPGSNWVTTEVIAS
jgi:hypothetical protein